MNTFKNICDEALHQKLVSLSADERRLTLDVLHHLREVEARRLYANRGHSSLFEYVVRELGYSESSAQRRISAMRALKGIPELESKVESGELKISQLAQVQSFIRSESKAGKIYDQESKRDLILEVVGKSARETEKVLTEKNPSFAYQEKSRMVSPELTQITFTADEALIENLKRVRNLYAHRLPCGATHAELFRFMSDQLLKAHEKKMKGPERKTAKAEEKSKDGREAQSKTKLSAGSKGLNEGVESSVTEPMPEKRVAKDAASSYELRSQNALPTSQVNPKQPSRYIPAPVKRAVWKRDEGKCVFVAPDTGRKCGSTHLVQEDHIILFSKGGASTVENLRLLCRSHNLSEARRVLGKDFVIRAASD